MADAPPILYANGTYGLNRQAGITVDVERFDHLADKGEEALRSGHAAASVDSWKAAVVLYRGDICVGTDVHDLVERERLRARHLTLLARLADFYLKEAEFPDALKCALRLLQHDPCREDAHRVVMRCHVRLGERAQAMRQYKVCRQVLWREFGTDPEPATVALFSLVRFHPERA